MDYDAVIVGCGHNGLVAAFYLAKAGLRVLALESRDEVGGMCATDELFPGYHFSTCAHSFVLFHTKLLDEMRLLDRGLRIHAREPEMFHPFASGEHLLFWHDTDKTLDSIARISPRDARAYPAWQRFWERAGRLFEPFLLTPPPTLGEFIRRFEGGPDEDLAYKLIAGTTRGIVEEFFESEEMRASTLASFDAGSTDAAGSLLYWAFHASVSGPLAARKLVGYPQGGMGSVARALKEAAVEAGAKVMTGKRVDSVLVRDGAAVGVQVEGEGEIRARAVLSNADPRKTFLSLVGTERLPAEFSDKVRRLHTTAGYMKLHCAASGLPDWTALPGSGPLPHHRAQARMCRSLDVLDDSWNAARRENLPEEFSIALVCPSIYDPNLAPPGHHTITIWVEFAPINPAGGGWSAIRERATDQLIGQVARHAPNIIDIIQDRYLHTPADIEARVGASGGSMHHLDMTLDQMLARRPLPECADYRTPLRNLYLCGAGSHPGGGVTGLPGHNAASAVVEDLGRSGGLAPGRRGA